ncbi:hypothetical protein PCANB_000259 [Pneumocystis canis]|nr:hypothetical protein PCANB_000259 [Pneumocystis canis]
MSASVQSKDNQRMIVCGSGLFDPNRYTCFDGLACPIIDGIVYFRCSNACYSPLLYHCISGVLYQGPEPPEKRKVHSTSTTTTSSGYPYYPPSTTQKIYPKPTTTSAPVPTKSRVKPTRSEGNNSVVAFGIFTIICIASLVLFL